VIRAALAAGALFLAGCVFLVNDLPEQGATCGFEGDANTDCGACVKASCTTALNGCCGDATCLGATMPTLDRCAGRGETSACATLSSYVAPSVVIPGVTLGGTPTSSLRACVVSSCGGRCRGVLTDGGATAPRTDGGGAVNGGPRSASVACFGTTDTCSCSWVPETPNRNACTAETVENALCCAEIGWPARGLSCNCQRVECKQTTDGCECASYINGPDSSCSRGAHCCVSSTGSSCDCHDAPCDSLELEVSVCGRAALACSGDRVSVTACAP